MCLWNNYHSMDLLLKYKEEVGAPSLQIVTSEDNTAARAASQGDEFIQNNVTGWWLHKKQPHTMMNL